jgi:hypothetical protein
MFESIENAIQAARAAQQEILRIEATPNNRRLLDASYSALSESIRQLTKLLEPVEVE